MSDAGDVPLKLPTKLAQWVVIAAGVVFSLYLQTLTHDGVFFSGDGGVKLLLTKQFASGNLHPDLQLTAEPWVRALWGQGYFPLRAPFAYELGDRWYSGFPIFSSLVAAPGYALVGYRGLYVVPLLSLWVVWLLVARACQQLEFPSLITVLVLSAVVFGSPLTLYGAMFWEHTLGVALATAAVCGILGPNQRPKFDAVLAGVLLGLSTWFRSELLCFVAIVIVLVAMGRTQIVSRSHFIGSSLTVVATLFALNALIYGTPLGAVGEQLVGAGAQAGHESGVDVLVALGSLLVQYFPLTLAGSVLLVVGRIHQRARALAYATLAFLILAPTVLPNAGGQQWGPRYLLVLVPVISVLVGLQLDNLSGKAQLRWCSVLVAATILWGGYENVVQGSQLLRSKYAEGVRPALEAVTADKSHFVVAAQEWMPLELAATWGDKTFFRCPDKAALKQLAAVLFTHGERRFLFLAERQFSGSSRFRGDGAIVELHIAPLPVAGPIVIHEVTLQAITGTPH